MARRCVAVRRTAERDDCARRVRRLRQRHRHKWEGRRTSEGRQAGEREAVREGNVAENMTVPRKDDGQIASTAMLAHDNVGLHVNGHTFRFTSHNNRKGVAAKAALNTKMVGNSPRTQINNSI